MSWGYCRVSELEKPIGEAALRSPTVLIVEDDVLIRMAISNFLQESGLRTLEASSADEAIEMIGCYGAVIDLVFSDVRMPGSLNGLGLARWIRENRPTLPVMLCSGDASQEESEGVALVRKPYDFEAVLATIQQSLKA
jgi:CheY-like chemotaxis protein